jgi:hypothetical protein
MQRRERAKFIISSDLLYGEHGLFIEDFFLSKSNL